MIDDEERVGLVVEKVLRRLGYSVRRFRAADEFYAELKSAPFQVDLLLTDQTMPHMTGLQLAKLLRAEGHAFPIAIASGHSQDLTPEALGAVGRTAFIQKPFDVSKLAAVTQELLRQAPPGALPSPGRLPKGSGPYRPPCSPVRRRVSTTAQAAWRPASPPRLTRLSRHLRMGASNPW